MKRPTIADIAREAGVSKGAVSYALNGQPGVSRDHPRADHRDRRRDGVPAQHRRPRPRRRRGQGGRADPAPAAAARSAWSRSSWSSSAASRRELSTHSYAPAAADGDRPRRGDRRLPALVERPQRGRRAAVRRAHRRRAHRRAAELRLPAVVVGPPTASGALARIWSDDGVSLVEAVEYLAALGHRRIARVAGLSDLAHTELRNEAFAAASARPRPHRRRHLATDYTGEDGARATRRLLAPPPGPRRCCTTTTSWRSPGCPWPRRWASTCPPTCRSSPGTTHRSAALVHPPLTALSRDIAAYGTHAARLLLAAIAGEPVASVQDEPAHLNPAGQHRPGAGPAPAAPGLSAARRAGQGLRPPARPGRCWSAPPARRRGRGPRPATRRR